MKCENCSYIADELNTRINWYFKESEKHNIYQNLSYDEIITYETEYCWCEKIGGKIYWYGQCGDACSNKVKNENRSKYKKRSKRERDLKYKKHLEYIYKNSNGYPSSAYPIDKYGRYIHSRLWCVWFPDNPPQEIAYYKRCYRSNNGKKGSSRYHKKMSNRKIRRYKGEIPNGFWCHKLYDYWWEMY